MASNLPGDMTLAGLAEALAIGLTDEQWDPIAKRLESRITRAYYERAMAIFEEQADRIVTPRITFDGEDVTAQLGGGAVWYEGGESRFRVLNFRGATGVIDDYERDVLHIYSGGAGGDCMFNFLVSECWAQRVADGEGIEGQTMLSASGCSYRVYSTVQGAVTQAATDFPSNSIAILFVCPGDFPESVAVASGQDLQIFGSGMRKTIIGGRSGSASLKPVFALADGSQMINSRMWLQDLTIIANDSTTGTASAGVYMGGGTGGDSYSRLWASNCRFEGRDSSAGSQYPIYLVNNADAFITGCEFGGDYGARLNGAPSTIVNCNFDSGMTTGVRVCDGTIISACQFSSATRNIYFAGTVNDVVIDGNFFIGSAGTTAIEIVSANGNYQISNNKCYSMPTFIDVTAGDTSFGAMNGVKIFNNTGQSDANGIFLDMPAGPLFWLWEVHDNTWDSTSGSNVFFRQGGVENNDVWPGFKHWGNFYDKAGSSLSSVHTPVEGTLNAKFTAGIGYVYATSPFAWACTDFRYRDGATTVTVAHQSVATSGANTYYIFITQAAGVGTLGINTTGYPAGCLRIMQVTTGSGAGSIYVSHIDDLTLLAIEGASGGTGTVPDHDHTGDAGDGDTIDQIIDDDADTYVKVEATANENIVRFGAASATAAAERMRLGATDLVLANALDIAAYGDAFGTLSDLLLAYDGATGRLALGGDVAASPDAFAGLHVGPAFSDPAAITAGAGIRTGPHVVHTHEGALSRAHVYNQLIGLIDLDGTGAGMTLNGENVGLISGVIANFGNGIETFSELTAWKPLIAALGTPGSVITTARAIHIVDALDVVGSGFGTFVGVDLDAFATAADSAGYRSLATMRQRVSAIFGGSATQDAVASALVEMVSTTQGVLPPRMTTVQRDAIGTPATGLLIYNTTTSTYNFYDGATWIAVGTSSLAAHDHTSGAGDGGVLSGDEHDSFSEYAEIAAPATPAAGKARIYVKSDGLLYVKDDAGVEREAGVVAHLAAADPHAYVLDSLFTTKGDIAAASAANTPVRVGVGADKTVPYADAAQSANMIWRPLSIVQNITFQPDGEDLTADTLNPRQFCVGESGEHGTFTAIRAKATAGTAGTGTTTILIEADDNPAFTSPTVLFTLALNTSTEVDDTVLDNAWASGDIHVRARCTAVGATAPKNVAVHLYVKQQAEYIA